MKILKFTSLTVLALSILFASIIIYLLFKTVSPITGTIKLQGLQGPVTIYRDAFGVPHIIATKSDLDAYFALGYVHAQDRFWQMEFNRRVAQGTLSEIFGPATLPEDKFLRTWGFYRAAQAAWPAYSPQSKAILQSYTDGVNAFLQQKHYPLPIELLHYQPQPWTVIDSLAWQKIMAWDLQNTWEKIIENALIAQNLGKDQIHIIFPPYPSSAPTVLSNTEIFVNNPNLLHQQLVLATKVRNALGFVDAPDIGSNNWVVSGKLTNTGKPLLANDPHLALSSPSIWYLAELKGPSLHIIGATNPGVPAVIIGHNDHIAWGMTNVKPDAQELYIEPSNIPLTKNIEIIKIRGKHNLQYPVYFSKQGPIISPVTPASKINNLIALHWTALMPNDTTIQSIMEINHAQNWQEFVQALQDFVVPSQNMIYADTQGNIGYYLPGKIPIRQGWNGALPVPDDNNHQWSGYIPFDQLPHTYNPIEGIIATANNKVVNENYPYLLTFRWDAPPYRIDRIDDLLTQERPLTLEKMTQIQNDTLSLLWQDLAPTLLKTQPLDNNSKIALQLLKNWSGDTDLNSVPATVFAYWYRNFSALMPSVIHDFSPWPEPLFLKQQFETDGAYCRINHADNCADFLSKSLQLAMNNLTNELGDDPAHWQWHRVHYAKFEELGLGKIKILGWIWNRQTATPGGYYTVNVGTYDINNFLQTDGPAYRQVIDLNQLNNSLYIQTPGQSNNLLSEHYDDLMLRWRDGKYISMSTDPKQWGKTEILNLLPAG